MGEGLLKSFWRHIHWISGAAPPWISTLCCKDLIAQDFSADLAGDSYRTEMPTGAFLTPISTPVNLMVFGPRGYKFGDYWKFGLPIGIWWFVVVLIVVPLYWRF